MPHIHIKSDSRRKHEAYVLDTFRKSNGAATSSDREAAEVIAARSREAYNQLKKMEDRRNG